MANKLPIIVCILGAFAFINATRVRQDAQRLRAMMHKNSFVHIKDTGHAVKMETSPTYVSFLFYEGMVLTDDGGGNVTLQYYSDSTCSTATGSAETIMSFTDAGTCQSEPFEAW